MGGERGTAKCTQRIESMLSPELFAERSGIEDASGSGYNAAMNWIDCPEIERNPQKVSGSLIFRGTRVPVSALFENLEDGATVDQFLEWFPGVTRRQVEAVLEHATASLIEAAA